jgi:DNA-binding response OmpR family regulator
MVHKPVVLVAEDEKVLVHDLCETVREAGYEVEGPYRKVSCAMLAYQKRKPDLAILGVQLTDGNAFPLAEQMMAENVPVIIHSQSYTPDEVQARCPKATALSRPCPPSAIIGGVKSALGGE